jgi:hypothetical protein
LLRPNETAFFDGKANVAAGADASGGVRRYTKPHIFELDLHHERARRLAPEFDALFSQFAQQSASLDNACGPGAGNASTWVGGHGGGGARPAGSLPAVLNERLPGLNLAHGGQATTLKLQYNEGAGGCFPLHYDNPGRRFFLNI